MDTKFFWKAIKLLLYDKVVGKDRMHLAENNEILKTELETKETFNCFSFFFLLNVVKNFKISK